MNVKLRKPLAQHKRQKHRWEARGRGRSKTLRKGDSEGGKKKERKTKKEIKIEQFKEALLCWSFIGIYKLDSCKSMRLSASKTRLQWPFYAG